MKMTPEEYKTYRREKNREHQNRYRAAHPDRYALYMIKTTIRKMKSLGMDVRPAVERLMEEEGI